MNVSAGYIYLVCIAEKINPGYSEVILLDNILKAAEIIRNAKSVAVLTGAGASTESGIPDFRSSSGISKKYDIPSEVILSHSFFMNHTDVFYDYYLNNLIYPDAKPNECHIALAEMENLCRLSGVITQNIDGLHQKAGSKNVIELHGSVKRNFCMKCRKQFSLEKICEEKQNIPSCDKCGGTIKPDVVLYEESLNSRILNDALNLVIDADTLLVIGTSLVVYPAAGLLNYFRGNNLIIINLGSTPFDRRANVVINDKAGTVLKKIVEELKKH
ncbi:MAG: NAD-dependent protein deacylase [Clostridiaceae bacterium]|jgi:NAD-dependent deacetylase|nr:NAD-dependent protein deacylase [Clostridiaceae bacterium]